MATYVRYRRADNVNANDAPPTVWVDSARRYNVEAQLTAGSGTIVVNARDYALVKALDGYWPLKRVDTTSSGPTDTFAEPIVATLTDPQAGDVLALDSGGGWTNAPGGGSVNDATVGALPSVSGKQTKLNYRGIVAASTAYAIGDVVVYRGKRILITTAVTSGAGTTPFISGGNYVSLTPDGNFFAGDWGVVGDGSTDNATALQSCINAVSALGGGMIQLPFGVIVVGTTIDVLSNIIICGQGHFAATQLRLAAGANCDVVTMHRSSGSGNSNAFYSGLMHMSVDGNRSNQTPGAFFNGVTVVTNPYNSNQTGDPDFDPKHLFFNVWFRQCTGHGFYYSGRSDLRVIGCFAQYNNGHGYYSSFDSHYDACVAGFNGLTGFAFFFSAVQATNCKSYNNGVLRRFQTGLNYTLGQPVYYSAAGSAFDGSVYVAKAAVTGATLAPPADVTNWALAAAPNTLANSVANDLPWGHGYYAGNPTGVGEVTIAGCAAEQNSSSSFYLRGKGCAIQGVSANPNWDNQTGGTGTNKTTNPDEFAHVVLDGASGSVVNVGCGAGGGGTKVPYGLGLLTGSTKNTVVMGDDNTAAAVLTPSSIVAVGSGNSFRWNGASITDVLATIPDVVITTPTDGQSFVFDAGLSKWKNGSPGAGSAFAVGLFGDGSGGSLVLDGSSTIGGMSRSGSTYTMTGDVFAVNLTVNSGVTLKTSGFKVFCTGTLTVAAGAFVDNAGNDGAAIGTAGAATPNGTTVPGTAGGAGNVAAGTAGSNNGTVAANIGVGTSGAGGASGTGNAGGGQAFAGSSVSTLLRSPITVSNGTLIFNGGIRGISGAPSGGGGGGDGTNKGGGGGGGGGALLIFARAVANHGTLTVKGGNGGSPATGNAGGGGGGGGGVIAVYTLSAWTNDGTTSAAGGTGGTPIGTGVVGSNGSAGTVTNFVVS